MAVSLEELAQYEWLIRNGLTDGKDHEPFRLIDGLRGTGYRDQRIRAAIWRLIDRGEVAITPDRRLRLTSPSGR